MTLAAARLATIVEWLDDHSGAATALLTCALVLVTVYYAVQNQRMVSEMAKSRELAILPKLAIEMHHLGPAVVDVGVRNVGPGPALAVDVELMFEPIDEATASDIRRYRQSVMVPGEQHRFRPPGEMSNNLDVLPRTYRAIRLTGSMKDGSGKSHAVNETFDQLAEWRDLLHAAGRLWEPPEAERRLAEALAKKLEPSLKSIGTQSQAIARAIHGLRK